MKTPEDLAKETLLKKFKFNPNTWTDFHTAFIYGYDAAKPEWVSVKERMPEKTQPVIWWNDANKQMMIEDLFGVSVDDDEETMRPLKFFTHWMPLPDAPKGEG